MIIFKIDACLQIIFLEYLQNVVCRSNIFLKSDPNFLTVLNKSNITLTRHDRSNTLLT